MSKYLNKLSCIFLLILLLLLQLFMVTASYADVITLKADNWCPYNCSPTDTNPGYMIDIAKEVFAKHGHTINYEIINWSRAISEASEGKIEGIVGPTLGGAEGFYFPKNNLGYLENVYITLKDNGLDCSEDLSFLNGYVLGVISDYHYGEKIAAYIKAHKGKKAVDVLTGNNALERLFEKLDRGRIDLFIENEFVAMHVARKIGMVSSVKVKHLEKEVKTEGKSVYIAFSPVNPKSAEYAEILSKGVAELRESGRLDKIMAKYGLEDWK